MKDTRDLKDLTIHDAKPVSDEYQLRPSEEGTTSRSLIWQPRTESGLDCHICAIFASELETYKTVRARYWP